MIEEASRGVAVYVTTRKDINKAWASQHWTLRGSYATELEAVTEIQKVLSVATLDPVSGKVYRHARLVVTHTYSPIGS